MIISGTTSLQWFRNYGLKYCLPQTHIALLITIHLIKVFPCSNSQVEEFLWFVLSIPKCIAWYVQCSLGWIQDGIWTAELHCWFPFQQSVYMYVASNVEKKKYKNWLYIVKKRLGRGIFVLFSKLFPRQTWNFATKIFHYWLFPMINGHRPENVLLMKFEILGLVTTNESRGFLQQVSVGSKSIMTKTYMYWLTESFITK